jgi:Fe(3+) dicitrate transport protein
MNSNAARSRRHASFLVLAAALAAAAPAVAQPEGDSAEDETGAAAEVRLAQAGEGQIFERIIVTGSAPKARETGGSVQFIGPEFLETFSYTDVNRVLRQAPGVYIQEEEGFGTRPNIGLRGTGTDRSNKIAVMEDGVLMAPAPYAAPAAYYFPHMGRMHAVEVIKGPAAIKYGPLTAGGALHFFSTPIPDATNRIAGKLDAIGGSRATLRIHGVAGGWIETGGGFDVGLMVETLQDRTDGFKKLDGGGKTGYQIEDYVAKLAFRSAPGARFGQQLELKAQYSSEDSDETYLGLTLDDFRANPHRRYRASQFDNIEVEHRIWQATHRIDFHNGLDLTTLAYYTETSRAWYKLHDVVDAVHGRVTLSAALADPAFYASAYQSLVGEPGYVSADNALRVRNNARDYYAWGVQTVLGAGFDLGPTSHLMELSVRYHEDEEDRFQEQDNYRMDNGRMVLTNKGAPGTQDNRVGHARAWAFFIRDTIDWGRLTIVPGLRYETISLRRTDYALGDASRAAPTNVSTNNVDVWIPGVSMTWHVDDNWRLVGGVHRGFTNPGPGSNAEAETSWNYEAGVRFDRGLMNFEAIGFFSDYVNLVGTCTASTGGGCNIGDQFDGGAVHVKGVEVTAGYDAGYLVGKGALSLPLSLAYTFTQSEFRTSFTSNYNPWGTVQAGDELPYLPNHQLTLNAGLGGSGWRVDATVNYVTSARARAGRGAIPASERIDSRVLVDLSGSFDLTENVALFASVENLFDTTYNVAFSPAGARPAYCARAGACRYWRDEH